MSRSNWMWKRGVAVLAVFCGWPSFAVAAGRFAGEDPAALAAEARQAGDAQRGAVLFYQPLLGCKKCHAVGDGPSPLGPDLTQIDRQTPDAEIVRSILQPSATIKKGYETVRIVTADGKTITGLIERRDAERLVLRDAGREGERVVLSVQDIELEQPDPRSMMPEGLADLLTSRQQLLDLIRYVLELRDGGAERARELEPPPSLYVLTIPEYEQQIDHAGMIADLDRDALRRGEAIYNRLCINCHGTVDQPGTLPTAVRFARDRLKNGCDPYSMYQTLTRGFGMMAPQTWMVPQQKYDVIHYIREHFFRPHNPSQYVPITAEYLAGLPKGTTRGPEPSDILPWEQMNYGPTLTATYEVPWPRLNLAYKGIAVRLDAGPGGVAHGHYWMLFEHDTLRMAAAWSGEGFIDWNGINFNGRHGVHPRIVGQVAWANAVGPGWADPQSGSFDDPRLRGRDGRAYGPLPRTWGHYRGLYHCGDKVVFSYTVGQTEVLEQPGLQLTSAGPIFTRTFRLGPRSRELILQVAEHPRDEVVLVRRSSPAPHVRLQPAVRKPAVATSLPQLDGRTSIDIDRSDRLDMDGSDYSIAALIKTERGGTIFAKTLPDSQWVPDGKALFVRGGRLVFDIGWVGAVRGRRAIDDGRWHHVAMTWQQRTGRVRLYVDGRLDGEGRLRPKKRPSGHVARIGFAAEDFPRPQSYFEGSIAVVRFYGRELDESQIARLADDDAPAEGLVAAWDLTRSQGDRVADLVSGECSGRVQRHGQSRQPDILMCGVRGPADGAEWLFAEGPYLRLRVPAGERPLQFQLWTAAAADDDGAETLAAAMANGPVDFQLEQLLHGGPPRWPQQLATRALIDRSARPLAVDVLEHPVENPWFCQLRLTGLDFLPGGDAMAVCTWDGDVWLVRGLSQLASGVSLSSGGASPVGGDGQSAAASGQPMLSWQRIASGLFQPLGLKVVGRDIYVTCRDQICVLRDLNGDGETDFYENFNSDHQVTEHFHEFAMGLQRDAAGNFYYAKSARHALPALVPHHGTLLRVSPDGSRTDIIATGFRAANGVCLNPDGTFFVTDQEGHWTPKNRINWVRPGRFYGNMWAYHDVEDPSDEAMEQPLCWITNEMDRSPAELLWVDSPRWGPLRGSLLNLSYGYGKIFVVPHERVGDVMQGGVSELPVPQFPTGIMRGRFHPLDQQLYVCGMFAWAGTQQQPGGLYRVRYTGRPIYVPIGLHATTEGVTIRFSGELDRQAAEDPANYAVKVWSLKRSAQYGSKHYNEHGLAVRSARLDSDGCTVHLVIPDIAPTWCMEVRYRLRSRDGRPIESRIHNTIHVLGPSQLQGAR